MCTCNLTLSFVSCFLILSANHAFISPIRVLTSVSAVFYSYFNAQLLLVQQVSHTDHSWQLWQPRSIFNPSSAPANIFTYNTAKW